MTQTSVTAAGAGLTGAQEPMSWETMGELVSAATQPAHPKQTSTGLPILPTGG